MQNEVKKNLETKLHQNVCMKLDKEKRKDYIVAHGAPHIDIAAFFKSRLESEYESLSVTIPQVKQLPVKPATDVLA